MRILQKMNMDGLKHANFVVTSITIACLRHSLLTLFIVTFFEILTSTCLSMLQYQIPFIYLVH